MTHLPDNARPTGDEQPAAEEVEQFFREYAATRDAGLREKLIIHHLDLVSWLARRRAGRGEQLDDLIQVGYIGLIKAIDRFEPERGTKFLTYAIPTVDGEMRRYLRDKCNIIRIPRHLQELRASVDRAVEQLTQQLGRRPEVEEIAAALGVEPQQVEAAQGERLAAPVSLDHPRPDDEAAASPGEISRENEEMRRFEDRLILEWAIQGLAPRQRAILKLLFYAGLSQSEIGELLNISQMHVSRLSRAALESLREGMTQDESREPGV